MSHHHSTAVNLSVLQSWIGVAIEIQEQCCHVTMKEESHMLLQAWVTGSQRIGAMHRQPSPCSPPTSHAVNAGSQAAQVLQAALCTRALHPSSVVHVLYAARCTPAPHMALSHVMSCTAACSAVHTCPVSAQVTCTFKVHRSHVDACACLALTSAGGCTACAVQQGTRQSVGGS